MVKKHASKDEAILGAAIKLFADRGYYATKVSKIAEQAGITSNSVYKIYKTKQQILDKILFDLWNQLAEDVSHLASDTDLDPIQKIDSSIEQVFNTFTSYPERAVVAINEHNHFINKSNTKKSHVKKYEQFLEASHQIFSKGVEDGFFSPMTDIKVFLNLLQGGLRNIVYLWINNPSSLDAEELKSHIKEQIKYGILKG